MAFTKVSPAGIGSTPGDGYRIGDSFLHSTGVEITNINATGILTAASLDISGSIDFDGHTELDNLNVAGVSTHNEGIFLPDGKIAKFGNTSADPDLEIYHGGTNSIIKNSTGRLYLGANDITVSNRLLNETKATFNNNASVDLYYNGTKRFETTNTGVTIDGTAVASGLDINGNADISGNIDVDGHTNLDNVSIAGIVTATDSSYHQYYALGTSTVGGIRFGNNAHTNGYIYYDNGANMNFQAGGSERLRITDDGFIGINEDDPKTGLTISKLGDYSTNDGNTYYIPLGKWSSAWNKINAVDSNTDYWVGFVGGYHKTGNSVNISLAPNRGNLNAQQGMYISGEATAISSSDFTIGKIVGGNTLGQATSGGQRATKSELFRISNSGNVGISSVTPTSPLEIHTNASAAWKFRINTSVSDGAGFYQRSNGDFELVLRDASNTNNYIAGTSGALQFATSGTERVRIDSDGRLLVGQDSSINGIFGSPPPRFSVSTTTASPAIFATYSNNTYASRVDLLKSRATNVGTHTVVQAGDALGEIYFGGSDGDQYHAGALIQAVADTGVGNDDMPAYLRFYTNGGSTTVSERLRIDSSGNVQIGNLVDAGNTLRYLDVANYNTGSNAASILRLLTTFSNGSSSTGLDIVKYKAGGAYIINRENVGADTGFIAFNTGSSGITPATHMRIAGNGEVVISPRNGGASNNRTSIHFNNAAHTPFIAFKSNNVTEAAYLRVDESSGGANYNFQTKNTSGTLLSRLTLKHNGEIVTHQLAGNEKGYPLVMGTGTVSNNTSMSGSLNMHDINGVHTGGGNNYHIGGWVFLGNDQAAAPYPVRRFKIFAPSAFSNGTIVYQVWHDGDSNYYYGGLWEIRINLWTDGDIEGVSLRCVNGYRDDLRVFAYNDSNGIMVQPSSIWGRCFIRRFGYDDGGRNPGSSHCAVANNGALAIYNSSGTDDGTIPTGGSPAELYAFDGTGGSNGASHTGLYNREGNAYARG